MIVDHISKFNELSAYLAPELRAGLQYLVNTDFSNVAPGRQDIDGEAMYASIDVYQTEPREARRAEAHVQYIDIQYMVEGQEIIACSLLANDNEVLENHMPAKDVVFYKTVGAETDVVLTPGMFAIFFPWDVHRPCCAVAGPERVKKVVVKIRVM